MKKRGVGMACIFYGTGYGNGFPDASSAFVEIHDDGSATLLTGAVDVGQGSNTIWAQIVAEELGIKVEEVTVISADTDCTPDAGTTAATRQIYTTGNAIRKAVREAKKPLMEKALQYLKVNTPDGIDFAEGKVFVKSLPQKSVELSELCTNARFEGARFIGEATFLSHSTQLDENGQGAPYWPYAFGTQIVEVEVNTDTGEVEILKVVAAHDVGRALNPINVQGQIEGGVAQGIGMAIMEDVEIKEGLIKKPSFSSYLVPTFLDVPEIESIIVEDPEPTGPYGAKGVGEPALLPTAPAILNAIYDAIGVRITEMPATPEKILAALKHHTSY